MTDTRENLVEEARQNSATAAVMAGEQPKEKPARSKNPKPVIGYLVTRNPDELAMQPKRGWYFLPRLNCTTKDAEGEQAGFQAMAPASPPQPIYKVTITFELIVGGGAS